MFDVKKVLSAVFAPVLVIGLMPAVALADDGSAADGTLTAGTSTAITAASADDAMSTQATNTNTFTFSDTGITAADESGSGYEVNGTTLTIKAAGEYTLTGSCANGNVVVKKGTSGVTLNLSGLMLTSTDTAPIAVKSGISDAVISIAAGTTNAITDAETDTESEDYEGAAIKVAKTSTLTITGSGTLNVNGNSKNAIKGGVTSTINVGASSSDAFTLNVAAANNGIAADGTVNIAGGTINLGTVDKPIGNDGIKSEPDADDTESAGFVNITGGTITAYTIGDGIQGSYEADTSDTQGKVSISGGTVSIVTSMVANGSSSTAGDGIQAAKELNISGGTFNITTWGGYGNGKAFESADEAVENANDGDGISAKGLKVSEDTTGAMNISGGTFTLNCADDAVHSDGSITITGGTFTDVKAGDDGIHADETLTLGAEGATSGPAVNISASYEGLEGTVVNMNAGSGTIVSSDDGVNAANADKGDDTTADTFYLYINGGEWVVNAQGDGLDSNGSLYVTGGRTIVYGPTSSDNGVFDIGEERVGATFAVSGGVLFGMGSSGMAITPNSGVYVVFGATGAGMGGGTMPGGQPGGGMMPGGQPGGGMFGFGTMSTSSMDGMAADEGLAAEDGALTTQAASSYSISAGQTVAVKDSSGTTIDSTTAARSAQWVLYAGEGLTSGATYSLYAGSSQVATATATGSSSSGSGNNSGNNSGGSSGGDLGNNSGSNSGNNSGSDSSNSSGNNSGSGSGNTSGDASQGSSDQDAGVVMFRLYNPNSGEHFYTASTAERDNVVAAGWNYEGVGWTAPASSNTPVYRLYNANGGEHHYTMSASERDSLVKAGWKYEGIGWYSDDAKTVPLYREYNPNAFSCNHNYTTSTSEHAYLVSIGWKDEGVAWYGA